MVPFGLGLFLAMFFFRMWRLFLIFKKIKMTFWTLYGVTFLFYLPHLIDAIILTSMNMIRLFPVVRVTPSHFAIFPSSQPAAYRPPLVSPFRPPVP